MILASASDNVSERLMVYSPVKKIIGHAAQLSDISVGVLMGDCRSRDVAWVRFAIYWAARAQGLSFPWIGREVGGRDHTTVMHGYRRAEKLRQSDPVFKALCDELEAV